MDLSEDKKERLPLERAINRIYSISEVHKLLYESANFADIDPDKYFDRLIEHIKSTM
ncbi:MAG: hypothetical protein GWN01_12360, partial [Nitrosopumilaceae archaeon]|nr:hypothetical protein [Nitrosopumilaceae archaeon]NIU87486.1 hypothetical protein [Nitrosopumilaceae archaeon]NIX62270.1 hypothetical protein [Nitrosopumilaceae archaeon]